MINTLLRGFPFLLTATFLSILAWKEGTIFLSLKNEDAGKIIRSTQ